MSFGSPYPSGDAPPQRAVTNAPTPPAEPWCSNCKNEHSIEESCSDNAKRYGDMDYREVAADLQRRIDKAYPFLTAIRYAAVLQGTDAERWAVLAQAALTTTSSQSEPSNDAQQRTDAGGDR